MTHKYYEAAKGLYDCFERPTKMLDLFTEMFLALYRHDMGMRNKKWDKLEYDWVIEQLIEFILHPWVESAERADAVVSIETIAIHTEELMRVVDAGSLRDYVKAIHKYQKIIWFKKELGKEWRQRHAKYMKGLKAFLKAIEKVNADGYKAAQTEK